MTVILASASGARKRMLEEAGVTVTSDAPAIDEAAVKRIAAAGGHDVANAAGTLAELKARRVAARHRGALIIGADQILACQGGWYDKPATVAEARTQLVSLRGHSHTLTSAAVIMRDNRVIWRRAESAGLTMRAFSDTFLDAYLARIGDEVCQTVGAYRIEGLGLQLFSRIDGDHFVILGMPLLPLLEALRDLGELQT
ncbi:MAG: Maf family protein [Rhodospirillaceae bacterium]